MRWHKWFVRILVFGLLVGMVALAVIYYRWTDPVAVRQQVMASLEEQFPDADVTLEAARLRILGGILLTDLRLLRRDDLSRTDIAYVPSGVLYHDKERLLDGVLAFRKVELHRPRFRVIREADGRWNLEGLTKPVAGTTPLPTVVVNEGSLLFEDRIGSAAAVPLEIDEIQLTMINDPISAVTIKGTATSALLGKLQLHGEWERQTNTVHLSLQMSEMQLSTSLLRRLHDYFPEEQLRNLEMEGTLNLQLEFDYRPDPAPVWDYDVRCQLRDGKCWHPILPLPLDDMYIDARLRNRQLTVETATATSGPTKWRARGKTSLPDWENDFEAVLEVNNLRVCSELCSRLPNPVLELYHNFHPQGPVSALVELKKNKGKWTKKRCLLKPQEIQVSFSKFPYPVDGIVGTLDTDLLNDSVHIDLSSEKHKMKLTGVWKGRSINTEVDLHLRASDIPLDKKLLAALPDSLHKLASSFHPQGRCDAQAHFAKKPGWENLHHEYHIAFHDTSVKWDEFRYPIDEITGKLHIYPQYSIIEGFRGRHKGGVLSVSGRTTPWPSVNDPDARSRVLLTITGENIGIDEDLRHALEPIPHLAKAWDTMAPAGTMSFLANIDQLPGRPQDMDVAVNVDGCRIRPSFFPISMSNLAGQFRYHRNRLELRNVTAEHKQSKLAIGAGTIDISPKGGFYADIKDLRGNPVHPDDAFVSALPKSLRSLVTTLNLKDPVKVQTQLIVAQPEEPGSQPDIYWNGRGWLHRAKLNIGVELSDATGVVGSIGRYDGRALQGMKGNLFLTKATVLQQPLKNVHSNFLIPKDTPDVLLMDVNAPLFGGDISGQARFDFHSTMRYELNLTASQIDLRQFGHHNLNDKTNLQGKASGRLHLTGQGSGIDTLSGNGTINIPSGRLYNLPFLLDLLKFLGLRWPDRTAFEEAHANFAINGNRVTISKLDMWGNAVSLTGQGEVNLDGTDVQLDFYPSWARVEQLLPPVIKEVTPLVSKSLMKIEVRGRIGSRPDDLKFHKRPIPIIVDPLKQIHQRLKRIQKK